MIVIKPKPNLGLTLKSTLLDVSRVAVELNTHNVSDVLDISGVDGIITGTGYLCNISLAIGHNKYGATISDAEALANTIKAKSIDDIFTVQRMDKISQHDRALLNKRIGHLIVVKMQIVRDSNNHTRSQGLCVCDCGTVKWIARSSLAKGQEWCGLQCKYYKRRDLSSEIGKRYGHLTVTDAYYKNMYGRNTVTVKYKCDCGTVKEGQLNSVKRQKACSKTCICTDYGKKIQSVIGKRYGYLTVEEYVKTGKNGAILLKCKCDCGNVITAQLKKLEGGQTYCSKDCKKYTKFGNHRTCFVENTNISNLGSKVNARNTSGVRGVWQRPDTGRWTAAITFQGRVHRFGTFNTKQEAIEVRRAAEKRLFDPILEKYGKKRND